MKDLIELAVILAAGLAGLVLLMFGVLLTYALVGGIIGAILAGAVFVFRAVAAALGAAA